MVDISSFVERLKNNKLALPAIGIGVVAGGYFLLKNGGISTNSGGLPSPDDLPLPPGAGGGTSSGEGGAVTDSGIGDLALQQQGFMEGITSFINDFIGQVQSQIGASQLANQQAIEDLLNSQNQAVSGALGDTLQNVPGFLPDFGALQSAISQIPYLQGEQSIPNLGKSVGGIVGGIGSKATRITSTPISVPKLSQIYAPGQAVLGGRVTRIAVSKPQVVQPKSYVRKPIIAPKPVIRVVKPTYKPTPKPISRIVFPGYKPAPKPVIRKPIAAPKLGRGGGGGSQYK